VLANGPEPQYENAEGVFVLARPHHAAAPPKDAAQKETPRESHRGAFVFLQSKAFD
jgi:hypothetical protein